jgi:DNA-binding response OmpR family regulator
MKTATRILIADVSSTINQHVKSFLEERNFQVYVTNDGEEALNIILSQRPQLALIDLLLPKKNALTILKDFKTQHIEGQTKTKIAILSNKGNVQNIKECLKWGAIDFILKPLEVEELISRIIFHLQPSRTDLKPGDKADGANLFLHLIEMALQQAIQNVPLAESLRKITQMTAMSLKSVRTSVIKVESNRIGVVKASSDDFRGTEWTLDLRKYPEIIYAMNTGKTLAIENLDNDPTLNQIKKYFSEIAFNSMIVVPIPLAPDQYYGVVAIRMPVDRVQIFDDELRYAKVLAQAISIAIKFDELRTGVKAA